MIAGCSSGVEPAFALAFAPSKVGGDRVLTFMNPIFERWPGSAASTRTR